MLRHQLLLSAIGGLILFGLVGCKHKCCRSNGSVPPPPFLPAGPGGSTIPPAGVPLNPGSTYTLPPAADLRPSTSGRPAPEILLPDPLGPGGTSSQKKPNSGILGGPVTDSKPLVSTLEPPIAAKKPEGAVAALAGLPRFTPIKDGVALGRKPTLDGFDSLKKDGYKTVVYLYPAGTNVVAVRDLAETRGLAFAAIEATPEKLADAFAQVNQATAEKSARPAYVFDDDGVRTGAIAYLHFKTVDLESADVSKIRARAIGLADDSDFWPAIKQFLAR